MSKRVRKKKVYPNDVLDWFKQNGGGPTRRIANHFKCCKATIRSRIRELRADGHPIIPTGKGQLLLPDILKKENDAEAVIGSADWVVGGHIGYGRIGQLLKTPLKDCRKILIKKEDLQMLKDLARKIYRLVESIEIDEDYLLPEHEETKN